MVQERYELYCKALKEVSEIIKTFPESEKIKIPKSFMDFVEEKKDDSYEYKIEHIDDFQNQEMMEETKIMLSIIYRDFIASNEEREQIIKQENTELIQEEQQTREKYNPDNMFKKEERKIDTIENEEKQEIKTEEKIEETENFEKQVAMVEYKESIFKRIINWLKRNF